ncbi:MAG: hypothetical protein JWQ34_1883 [Mucilaginibacter sp.]|nr:hypothetical protein [Mucilaginibacter sp.]
MPNFCTAYQIKYKNYHQIDEEGYYRHIVHL